MIQSKNKVEKCSNTLIIVFMALYLLSGLSLGVSLLTGNFAEIKEYTKIDCIYDTLNSIIAFADTITRVDTSNIKAKEHLIPISNVFHDDEVIIHNVERDELLAASPTKTDGYITVPRVVEN